MMSSACLEQALETTLELWRLRLSCARLLDLWAVSASAVALLNLPMASLGCRRELALCWQPDRSFFRPRQLFVCAARPGLVCYLS